MSAFLDAFDRDPLVATIVTACVIAAVLVIAIEALWGWRERRAERKQRGLYLDFTGKTRVGIDKARRLEHLRRSEETFKRVWSERTANEILRRTK